MLVALLRRRLAELSGLPEGELKGLLGARGTGGPSPGGEPRATERRSARLPARRGPSLLRELIQLMLLQPELARGVHLPPLDDMTREAATVCALIEHCSGPDERTMTTAALLQRFADTPHDAVLAQALASAHDVGLPPEEAEIEFQAVVKRLWSQAQREGRATLSADALGDLSSEEAERFRQTALAQRTGVP